MSNYCPVCEGRDVLPVVHISGAVVHCSVMYADPKIATSAPTADIHLYFCSSCGHTWNLAFRPELVEYSEGYENSLYSSAVFRSYAKGLVERLTSLHNFADRTVLEIGSGNGNFLKALCRRGEARGVGFDPSGPQDTESISVKLIRDLYSEKYRDIQADFICCRHVLEHISDPIAFLRLLRRAFGEGKHSGMYFEVPNVSFLFEQGSIWDVIYAHVSYYSQSSLKTAFQRSGFRVAHMQSSFGDQFIGADLVLGNAAEKVEWPSDDIGASIHAFANLYEKTILHWRELLSQELKAGNKVVLWGAGAKGVSFLNAVGETSNIRCAVDLNPHKQGKFLPGSGVEVVGPSFLRTYQPDLVLIVNPIYEGEIKSQLLTLGLSATRMALIEALFPIAA